MSWFQVVPVALACAAWLFGPGLPLTYAIGLRGLAAWGFAPVLSVALISITAVVADKAGVAWSVPLVLVTTAVVAALAGGVSLLTRRTGPARTTDPRPVLFAAALGLVPAVVLGSYILVKGMGRPDQLSQTFDAVFHYSALAYILDERSASSLIMSTLGNPSTSASFYPAGWHAVVSLVTLSTGTPIAVAANLFSGMIAMLSWPVACLLLVRQIVGRSVAAMAITGIVSVSFTSFPWGLLGFGVLWPNTLGLSLVPAGVALVLSITALARDDVIGRGRALALVPFVLIACGFAHPNAVFSFAVVALFPIAASVFRWARRLHREGRTARGLLGAAGAVAAFAVVWWFVATTEALRAIRTQYWAPFETPARAVGEIVLNAPNGRNALWALSLLTLLGLLAAWRADARRWLVAAFVGTGFLYLLTASINRPDTQAFTGYWYNDSYRLAAMLPIISVPLAVLGILLAAEKLGERTASLGRPAGDSDPVATRFGALRTTTGLSLVVLFGLMVLSKFFYAGYQVRALATTYTKLTDTTTLVDPQEHAFIPRIADEVPEDAVVANNPWDGSAAMLAQIDRKPLFPHLDLAWSDEQRHIARHLDNAATDPTVCTATKRLGVQYVFIGNKTFWTRDPRVRNYPGIIDPRASPAFELVASDGKVKLYKLVGCDTPAPPPSR